MTVAMLCLLAAGDVCSHDVKPPPQSPPSLTSKPIVPPKAKAKAKIKVKTHQPNLKILSVDPSPLPFVVTERPLTVTIVVELPKTLPDEALLNVTILITSPSKSSIRVLESLLPITNQIKAEVVGEHGHPQQIEIVQVWDGTDQTKRVVPDGSYTYQVVAKLMAPGKNGPLTQATSWKIQGRFEVRER